jgi:hypothetical protein
MLFPETSYLSEFLDDPMQIDTEEQSEIKKELYLIEENKYLVIKCKELFSIFKLEDNNETCSICYNTGIMYFSENCEKPHYCCYSCWEKNPKDNCPICRKIIFK